MDEDDACAYVLPRCWLNPGRAKEHSRPQRPRSFWSAPRIATSGLVQHRKSAIHGLPVTLRMFRVKSDISDWFWSQSIVFSKPFKNGMSLDRARGRDSWCWPKGARPLGTRMAKEESRITCMRMLRTNQSKVTRSQPRCSRQCVAQCLFQLALWKKTFSLTVILSQKT